MSHYDTSMTPQNVKIPDFKVSTRIFEVENDVNWGRLGDCDDYFWTTPDERRERVSIFYTGSVNYLKFDQN